MATTTVRYYDQAMTGAPVLDGTVGAVIDLLDGCIAGFNSQTATSLVVASNVATFTKTSHGFAMLGNVGTGLVQVGPVITIAGATPSSLNGDWRIASVPDANTFTFATSGIGDQTATGTITAKYAAAPLTKDFTGTNKGVYSFNGAGGTGLVFRIDDSDARYPAFRGAESASDVDTLTNEIPRSASVANYTSFIKSSTADTTARNWKLITDGYFVYFFSAWLASNARFAIYWCGDIVSYMAADDYNFAVLGHESATPASLTTSKASDNLNSTSGAGLYLARAASQIGSPIAHGLHGGRGATTWGSGGLTYPGDMTTNLMMHYPVDVAIAGVQYRGYLPGAVQPVQSVAGTGADKDIHSTSNGNVLLVHTHTSGATTDALMGVILDEDWR